MSRLVYLFFALGAFNAGCSNVVARPPTREGVISVRWGDPVFLMLSNVDGRPSRAPAGDPEGVPRFNLCGLTDAAAAASVQEAVTLVRWPSLEAVPIDIVDLGTECSFRGRAPLADGWYAVRIDRSMLRGDAADMVFEEGNRSLVRFWRFRVGSAPTVAHYAVSVGPTEWILTVWYSEAIQWREVRAPLSVTADGTPVVCSALPGGREAMSWSCAPVSVGAAVRATLWDGFVGESTGVPLRHPDGTSPPPVIEFVMPATGLNPTSPYTGVWGPEASAGEGL